MLLRAVMNLNQRLLRVTGRLADIVTSGLLRVTMRHNEEVRNVFYWI